MFHTLRDSLPADCSRPRCRARWPAHPGSARISLDYRQHRNRQQKNDRGDGKDYEICGLGPNAKSQTPNLKETRSWRAAVPRRQSSFFVTAISASELRWSGQTQAPDFLARKSAKCLVQKPFAGQRHVGGRCAGLRARLRAARPSAPDLLLCG